MLKLLKISFVSILALSLFACATTGTSKNNLSIAQVSYLKEGKRLFEAGYYKSAMKELLPLACDGSAEAQYAVGYMYYYGYGVAQDTDVGHFWIKRSADKGYGPAKQALLIIQQDENKKFPHKKKLRYPSGTVSDKEEEALYY